MTSGDEGRAMPPAGPQEEGQAPPAQNEQPNLFKPISLENRITGSHRRQHRRVQGQPMPGSSYGFYNEVQAEGPVSDQRVEDGFSHLPPQGDAFSPYAQTPGNTGFYPPVSGVGQPYATGSFAAPQREPGQSTARFAAGGEHPAYTQHGYAPARFPAGWTIPGGQSVFNRERRAALYDGRYTRPFRGRKTHTQRRNRFSPGMPGSPMPQAVFRPPCRRARRTGRRKRTRRSARGQPYATGSFALPEREPGHDTGTLYAGGEHRAAVWHGCVSACFAAGGNIPGRQAIFS